MACHPWGEPLAPALRRNMELLPITYHGRLVAACSPSRVWLAEEVEALPVGDPVQVFVSAMCLYAASVLNGLRMGPYRDCDARAFARELLIPRELRECPPSDLALAAAALGVPEAELRVALRHSAAGAGGAPAGGGCSDRTPAGGGLSGVAAARACDNRELRKPSFSRGRSLRATSMDVSSHSL